MKHLKLFLLRLLYLITAMLCGILTLTFITPVLIIFIIIIVFVYLFYGNTLSIEDTLGEIGSKSLFYFPDKINDLIEKITLKE